MGDPLGIGPEIIVKSLADAERRLKARYRVYGMARVLEDAAGRAGIEPFWSVQRHGGAATDDAVVVLDSPEFEASLRAAMGSGTPGATKVGGAASYQWVEAALAAAVRPEGDPRRVDAVVTAPISKTSWDLAGHKKYPGHTELIAAKFHAKRSAMLFVGPSLRVLLATIHVPLMTVGRVLTIGKVFDAIELADKACKEMGVAKPRLAVCGLNPHAGEGGILGEEDDRLVTPAVELARRQGVDVVGPLPGDTVFSAAARPPAGRGLYDCVIAMYHDQGLIPVKLLDGFQAVNVTVLDGGLVRCVRTSPAHGTAFDIAGKNRGDAGSMVAAIELAVRMASNEPTK